MNLTSIMGAAGTAVRPDARPTNQWSTKPFECSNVSNKDIAYATICFPCAAAQAKSKVDRTNPVFNCLCFTPLGAYNSVRLSYGIVGTCSQDLLYGCLCAPCGTRQIYTEANTLGPYGNPVEETNTWRDGLFQCESNKCLQATFCPCIVAHDIRTQLMTPSKDEPWFNYLCILPMSMYGQTRQIAGIRSDWPHPVCEDIFVGCFFYPCGLPRANSEAVAWRLKQAGNQVTGALTDAKQRVTSAAANAKSSASNIASRFQGGMK